MKNTSKKHVILKNENNSFGSQKLLSTDFKKAVDSLSYYQLVRLNSVLSARNKAEKAEAKRFVSSLTPPERKIANYIERYRNNCLYDLNKKYVFKKLQQKNANETKNIDVDKLLINLGE